MQHYSQIGPRVCTLVLFIIIFLVMNDYTSSQVNGNYNDSICLGDCGCSVKLIQIINNFHN